MSTRSARPSSTSGDEIEMIWIYTTNNFAESEIITDIFDAEDIAYFVQRMEISQFPTSVGGQDQLRIAVEEPQAEKARKLLEQALQDKAIPGDGNFMPAT